jgi:hypothetical protein
LGNTRHRSPPFPFITLPKAIERLRQLQGLHLPTQTRAARKWAPEALSSEELRVAWKYGSKSSGLAQTAAALIQFGLLSPNGTFSGRRFEITSDALELVRISRWHPDMKQLMRNAAMMPKIHRELFAKFGGAGKIEDAEIERYLVIDRAQAKKAAFSPSSARDLIKEYRVTMRAAELSETEPRGHSSSAARGALEEANLTPASVPQEFAPSQELIESAPRGMSHRKAAGSAAKTDAPPVRDHERIWDQGPLSPTAEYRLLISGEVGEKEIEVLIRRLEISKQTLARKSEQ